MVNVLDECEVNALLAAVDGGEITFDTPEESARIYYSDYDFRKPTFLDKKSIREHELKNEGFTSKLEKILSGFSNKNVKAKMVSVEQLPYAEFIMSLPNPTFMRYFNFDNQSAVLEINPASYLPLIDLKFTDFDEAPKEPFEKDLIRLSSKIITAYSRLFPDFSFNKKNIAFDPLSKLVEVNNPILLTCFEISLVENLGGMLNIALPEYVIATKNSEWAKNETKFIDLLPKGYVFPEIVRDLISSLPLTISFGKSYVEAKDLPLKDKQIILLENKEISQLEISVNNRYIGFGRLTIDEKKVQLEVNHISANKIPQGTHTHKLDFPVSLDISLTKRINYETLLNLKSTSKLYVNPYDDKLMVDIKSNGQLVGKGEIVKDDNNRQYGVCVISPKNS